jgi:(p)ppGpp synthase/HD superfamily hydrolase
MYWDLSKRFESLKLSLGTKDRKFFQDVYDFSYTAHLGQKRKSWEDYFIHPLTVALNLHDKFWDNQLTCAWLLHDTVEDCPTVYIKDIYVRFGFEIWYIVDAVSKNKQTFYWSNYAFDRKIDKFLFGGINNIKCFLLKIADREDNLKTLTNLKDNKQVRMAFETQAIFTPLESMIWADKISSIKYAQTNLDNHLKERDIAWYLELKDYLINKTFKDFSTESFDSVYQNSNNVTWKINSTSVLDELLSIPNIDDKIETVSIESWGKDHFEYSFRFKKWEIIWNEITLWIWNTYSFSNK